MTKESGFTQINNELFEQIIKSDLTLRELKIVLSIIRYTHGFQRKKTELSVRFVAKLTGIKFQHIATTLKNLNDKNLVTFFDSTKHKQGRLIQLNENWKNSSQKGDGIKLNSSQKSDGRVPKRVTETVPKRVTKKERINKTLKKDYSIEFLPSGKETFYKNDFFFVDFDFRNELIKNVSGLTDEILFNEFFKMKIWLESNGKKKDYKRFVVNWLSKNDYSESKIYSKPEEKINLSFNPVEYYGQN